MGENPETLHFHETADIETSSEDYARRFSGETGEFFLEVQTGIVADFFDGDSFKEILDVGGGHAQLAVPLIQGGHRVTVAGSHESCRGRLDRLLPKSDFKFQVVDMLNLPYDDRQFDVVLAFRLLPHVSKDGLLINELCRVARKSVIVDYPDIRSFNLLYEIMFTAKKRFEGNTRPFRIFNRHELNSKFACNGFALSRRRAEFFLPMVVHRFLGNAVLSRKLESLFETMGATPVFGSPVIAEFKRLRCSEGHDLNTEAAD